MNTETDSKTGTAWEQKLALYHPNSAGSGAALQLEPRLNRSPGDHYNCFFLDMASQKSASEVRDGKRIPATFNWDRKLTVRLDYTDICELLAVLEGIQPQAGGKRNGLFHSTGNGSTVISFQKNTDHGGYGLALSRKAIGDESAIRITMLLSEVEAVGLRALFKTGLFFVLFHTHLLPKS